MTNRKETDLLYIPTSKNTSKTGANSASQDNVQMVIDDSYDVQQHQQQQQHLTHDHRHAQHHQEQPVPQPYLPHQHHHQPHPQPHQYNRQHPVPATGMVAYAPPSHATAGQQEPLLDGAVVGDSGNYRYHRRDSPEPGLVVGAEEAMDLDINSPGGPVSASAHEIFRGFSFIAPGLLDEQPNFANGSNMVMQQQPASRSPFSNEIPGVKPVAFGDEYNLMEELGRGTFSICRMCEHRTTKKHYAVKKWPTISDEVKDLLRQMLHIVPSRRPTAAQILRHPWLSRSGPRLMYNTVGTQHASSERPMIVEPQDTKPTCVNTEAIKGAVHATFRAISSPQAANLGPVGMSDLARRRMDKMNHS
uniref:Protein kinase domain-containing protein n=1 Tax=Anopheles christyi TaxID=43041 RepID=A0A182K6N5_9DIPT